MTMTESEINLLLRCEMAAALDAQAVNDAIESYLFRRATNGLGPPNPDLREIQEES